MDPTLAELVTPVSGWAAFGGLAVYVMRAVAAGTWVPLKTHLREIELITARADADRDALIEARKTITVLLDAQRITADFFRKVPFAELAAVEEEDEA
jgi:hypothetical protein